MRCRDCDVPTGEDGSCPECGREACPDCPRTMGWMGRCHGEE